jgi:hypothetical protein
VRDEQLTFFFKDSDSLLCSRCDQDKHFEEFHVNNATKRGRLARCKKCVSETCKERYSKDKTYHQEYYKKNKEKIIPKVKEYLKRGYRKEYRKRTHVKIARYQRKRIRELLNQAGTRKSHRTLKYIGCTTKELMSYLENKFQEGMTWENYGFKGWHIDHIRPCASFDLSDPEQQKQCFHHTNLQPLWAEDNMRKSAKWDDKC